VLQKWRNIGQFSAMLGRISDCWGAPDENCFTLSRAVGAGVHWAPWLEGKKEIPPNFFKLKDFAGFYA
jgi:hypothetical protein